MIDQSKIYSVIFFHICVQLSIAAPVPKSREINTRSAQLYRLDPKRISEAERRPWHPAELVAILGDQRGRHWQYIEDLSYNSDGKCITVNSRGHVYLWEAPNLRFRSLLPIEASFMQFVSERTSLLTCGPDGIVRLWDVSGNKPRSRVVMQKVPIVMNEVLSRFSHMAVSPDGKKIVVATGGGFGFCDMSTPNPKTPRLSYLSLGEGMTLLEAAFSPDSRSLVTLKGEVVDIRGYLRDPLIRKQEVTLWDVSGPKPKERCALVGPIWWWGRIVFSPDGKTVVCGSNVWDLSGDKPKFLGVMNGDKYSIYNLALLAASSSPKDHLRPLEGEDIQGCMFLPDSQHALTVGYKRGDPPIVFGLRVRDMRAGAPRILQTISLQDSYYRGMALSPDGKHLAVGESNYLNLWEMKEGKVQTRPPTLGHTQNVKALSFGACGNLLATIAEDGSLRLWDLDDSSPHVRLVHKQKFDFPWDSVAVSPDGTKLALGYRIGGFTLWEISHSGLRVLAEHKEGGRFLSFSPDSKMLFSASGLETINIIDVSKPKQAVATLALGRLGGHFRIEAMAVSPDGQTLAVGRDCDLELWQRTGSEWRKRTDLRVRGDVKSLSFGGRGRTLLVGGGIYKKPAVHLYDISGEMPTTIAAFTGLRDVAVSVTASSTGKLFAACDETGRVVVWSSSGAKLHKWNFPGPVHCVSFAPDGRHLALGNGDGTIYILRLTVPNSTSRDGPTPR